jgi:hypothetical protein
MIGPLAGSPTTQLPVAAPFRPRFHPIRHGEQFDGADLDSYQCEFRSLLTTADLHSSASLLGHRLRDRRHRNTTALL